MRSQTQLAAERAALNSSKLSRDNIKKNTKTLQCEIRDVDDEIARLQGNLFDQLASDGGSLHDGGSLTRQAKTYDNTLQVSELGPGGDSFQMS